EDGIRDLTVTGVQTCALPISRRRAGAEVHPSADVRVPDESVVSLVRVTENDGGADLAVDLARVADRAAADPVGDDGRLLADVARSEERRVGKECRSRALADQE